MSKPLKIVFISSLIVLAIVAFVGVPHYFKVQGEWEAAFMDYVLSDRFFDHSFINGVDVSKLSSEEATDVLMDSFDREISVSFQGKELGKFHYSDMPSFREGVLAGVSQMEGMQNITVDMFHSGDYEISNDLYIETFLSFNAKEVAQLDVVRSPLSSAIEASIVYNEEENAYELIEGADGLEIDSNKFAALVNDTIPSSSNEIKLKSSDLIRYYDEEKDALLREEVEQRNHMLNKMISISVCGVWEVIGPERIKDFYDLDTFTLDEEKVDAFIAGLKKNYDTFNSPRLFTTASGAEVTLPGGNYGWCINAKKTKESLMEAFLSEEEDAEMDATYSAYGLRPVNNELSNTYVEISIERQHIWMFVDGAMVISDDCTTGDIQTEQYTNRGMFRLTYKKEACNLRVDTDYFFVNYWMPFDGGIGMHDATWRTYEQFGGTNYLDGNGSHGCINLRLETAANIYNLIQSDTPIIVW